MKFIKKEDCPIKEKYHNYKMPVVSDSGFFSIFFLFFTVVCFMFIFSMSFLIFASQAKEAFRKKCVIELAEVQKRIILSEKKLLAMNAPSAALRLAKQVAYQALVVTPPPASFAILVEIEEIELAQEILDQTQRALIKVTEIQTRLQLSQIFVEANKQQNQIKRFWIRFINNYFSFTNLGSHFLKMPVRPDSWGGLAPNYELEENFESKQKLVLVWHNFFSILESTQKILNPKGSFDEPLKISYGLICSVEPEKKGQKWDVKIKLDNL